MGQEVVCIEVGLAGEGLDFGSLGVETREVRDQLGIDVKLGLFLLLSGVLSYLGIVRGGIGVDIEEETLVELARQLTELSEALFQRVVLYQD